MATEITVISNTACLLQVVLKLPHSVTRHLKHSWSHFHSFQCLSQMSTIVSVSRGPHCHNVSLEASHLIDQRCKILFSTYHPPLWFLHSLHSGFELRGTTVGWLYNIQVIWDEQPGNQAQNTLLLQFQLLGGTLFLKQIFGVVFFKDKSTNLYFNTMINIMN